MFYESLKESLKKYNEENWIIKDVRQFRGIPTIYELRETSIETRDEKIEMMIKLIRLIDWIGYTWSLLQLKISNKMNQGQYNQAFSNAITYAKKENIVVWSLQKLLTLLVQDVNCDMPNTFKNAVLLECLRWEQNALWVRNFDAFFWSELTEEEKIELKQRTQVDWLTWLKDLDWKAVSFSEDAKDWSKIFISNRLELSRITTENLIFILNKKIINNEVHKDMQELYENMDKISWKKRRGLLKTILTSVLFAQDYKKYEHLVRCLSIVRRAWA